MPEQEWIDLGKRAVACKSWRWMPGMLARYEGGACCRVTQANSSGLPMLWLDAGNAWPDFRDDATVDCLFALVQECWGAAHLGKSNIVDPPCWVCRCLRIDGSEWAFFESPTKAAALVPALEAAGEQ